MVVTWFLFLLNSVAKFLNLVVLVQYLVLTDKKILYIEKIT